MVEFGRDVFEPCPIKVSGCCEEGFGMICLQLADESAALA